MTEMFSASPRSLPHGDPRRTLIPALTNSAADRIALGLAGLALGYQLACLILVEPRALLFYPPDDAFYYLKIGENLVNGLGPTFDGLQATNGVQPLWQAIIAALSAAGGPPELRLRVVLLAQLVIGAVSLWLFFSLTKRLFPSPLPRLTALALFLALTVTPSVNGMESALLVLALTALLFHAERAAVFSEFHAKSSLGFGLLLGVAMLARLDSVFFSAVACVAALLAPARGTPLAQRLARPALFVAGASVLVVPYLALNLAWFGALMPISGGLKSSFPRPGPHWGVFSSAGKLALLGLAASIGYLIASLARFCRAAFSPPGFLRGCLVVASTGVVLHFAHELLFIRWASFSWHFFAYSIALSLVLAATLCSVLERAPGLTGGRSGTAIAAIVALACAFRVATTRFPRAQDWRVVAYDAALWARDHLSSNEKVAMKDAGIFGFFSGRQVVNLDGLVNGWAYQETLRRKEINRYLEENGVGYLVQHAFYSLRDVEPPGADWTTYETGALYLKSHRYQTEADPIRLSRKSEVYRSAPYYDGPHRTALLVWRLRRAEPFSGRESRPASPR